MRRLYRDRFRVRLFLSRRVTSHKFVQSTANAVRVAMCRKTLFAETSGGKKTKKKEEKKPISPREPASRSSLVDLARTGKI